MRLAWINANYDRIEYESALDLPRYVKHTSFSVPLVQIKKWFVFFLPYVF